MLGIIVAGVVTVIAAFGAAWFGARLQRKWTPDPVPPIQKLAGRIEELSQQVGAIERERVEAEHFTLGIRLMMQGRPNYYMLLIANDTDKDVSIETIQLFFGQAPLSDCNRPADWFIPAGASKQVTWSPEHDPIMTLKISGLTPQNFPVPYHFVLSCRVNGNLRTVRRNLLLTCRENTLSQSGP